MNKDIICLPDYMTTEQIPIGFKLTTSDNTTYHTHEYVEMFYIIDGKIDHHYEDNPTEILQSGDAYIIMPSKKHIFSLRKERSIHRDIFIRESFFCEVCNYISPTLYEEFLRGEHSVKAVLSQSKLNYIENQINFINQTLPDSLAQKTALIRCFAVTLLEPFLTTNAENHIHNFPAWFKALLSNFNKIEYIKQGLDAILSGFNYDRKYLCRVFKKNMGITMTEYLNRVRLDYALSMIQNTDKNILTIAQELGFSSISYFNVSFKKRYGIPPIKARKFK